MSLKEELVSAALGKTPAEVAETVAAMRGAAQGLLSEADQLERLMKDFPDLKKKVGRWNKVVFYSRSANTRATGYDSRHNCGCCADSPLEIWPYAETEHGRVYTDPPEFRVGERDPMFSGDRPYDGWDKKMRDAEIPEAIVSAVAAHFRRHAEEARAYVNETYPEEKT
jgi:hypothetical protein